jgi:leukotriene-A4 hydrolase
MLDFFASDPDASKKLNDLDWDSWFYKPGYPPKPDFDTSMVDACYKLADAWKQRAEKPFEPKKSDIEGWMANQSVVFLERIQTFDSPLRVEDVELIGDTYGFAKSENVELVSRYFGIGLKAKCKSCYQPTAELLGIVGRMKFVRPLFRLLNICDRELAVKTFEKNKDFYHPICRGMVEKDLFGEK